MEPLLRQNPGLHLDVAATDKLVDLVKAGFAAGVRLGESLPQQVIDRCGLAYVSQGQARRHIAGGGLRQCLDDRCVAEDLFLYYPSRRFVSAGLRVLIELLKA
jgi:DNA-binding transcriptional LysR family regulator